MGFQPETQALQVDIDHLFAAANQVKRCGMQQPILNQSICHSVQTLYCTRYQYATDQVL